MYQKQDYIYVDTTCKIQSVSAHSTAIIIYWGLSANNYFFITFFIDIDYF